MNGETKPRCDELYYPPGEFWHPIRCTAKARYSVTDRRASFGGVTKVVCGRHVKRYRPEFCTVEPIA